MQSQIMRGGTRKPPSEAARFLILHYGFGLAHLVIMVHQKKENSAVGGFCHTNCALRS
jgi:hypothetical protein